MQKTIEILIVEDSLTQAVQLQAILERNGYRVNVATDGRKGLASIEELKPDLVISDVVMPEMDGYELCERVRQNPTFKNTPVILLTSLSDPGDVIRALESGADNFVTKPYTEKFLISRIRNILLNLELRKKGMPEMGIEIYFANKRHFITSDRMQIVDLLFSTYENAVQKNRELEEANQKLKQMKKELEDRNSELEKLNEEKNRFLGMAAHDLRNPLGAISNFSNFLLDETRDTINEEQRNCLSMISDSSEFMLNLVNEFLDMATIESGKVGLDLQPTDIHELVTRNIALNRVFAEKKATSIQFNSGRGIPEINADPQKLQQVLSNLISNAIKYSPRGSTVEVRLFQRDGDVVIDVEDNGQGIPLDEMDKLFKPFGKTSVQTTAGESSTGLGLVIVKKIVEEHRGEITVSSEVGRGSVFTVILPAVENGKSVRDNVPVVENTVGALDEVLQIEETAEAGGDSEPGSNLNGSSLRILVAEDNVVNQKLAIKMLESLGHTVEIVQNGLDATEAFETGRYDMIFMDLQMPVMDGCSATEAIRRFESPSGARIPIVALTANTLSETRQRCRLAGIDAVLPKPFNPERISELIDKLMSA